MPTTADISRDRGDPVAIGVVVMVTFGALWSIAPLFVLPVSEPALAALIAMVVAGAVSVLVALHLRRTRRVRTTRRVSPSAGRTFHLVNLAQTVLIIGAVLVLGRTGRSGLIPVVTCLVVGLHFLPLAWIFDIALYWLTGSLLIAAAAAGGIGYAAGLTEPAILSIAGFSATTILWTTSLMTAKHG